ncbi:hypothetical protein J7E99_14985 [Streptomyces sp. ISL-44]|uniref:hypothetical protein n=1 Tax=Streptomyces sp. ISL-44 TaxID=2819184 RepID=UPI001BECA6F6|nr:hypothetical protein [Streptomyces sp. ISL-44]MBT2541974.1 hypothetical protein [Streptomyces sp. ISL-44]
MNRSDAPRFSRNGTHPAIDSLVYDEGRGEVGRVEAVDERVTLRPKGGGGEWYPEWEKLRPATMADVLRPRLHAAKHVTESHRAVTHPEIATLEPTRDPGT